MSWVSDRIRKFVADGRTSRLERPYTLCLVLLLVPGVYISCVVVTIFTTARVIEGHQSWGIWLGLIFNVLMLHAPTIWSTMVRARRWAEQRGT
jgi:hypothetical protein